MFDPVRAKPPSTTPRGDPPRSGHVPAPFTGQASRKLQSSQTLGISGGGFLTRRRNDTVIIRHSRVGSGVGIIAFASSCPVVRGSVYELTQQPLFPADVLGETARVMSALLCSRAFCASCCPTVLHGCGRHLLPVATGRHVCCALHRSRDSCVWSPIPGLGFPFEFFSVETRLRCISSFCCRSGRCYGNIQSRAASGASSGGENTAGLDVVCVSPRGSVVTPGSASCKPPSNAHKRA